MRRLVCMFIAAMTVAAVFVGCQKTPDTAFVMGKDLDGIIQKAQETEGSEQSAEFNIPDRLTDELTDKSNSLTIHVDADVEVPNTTEYPIVRVGKGKFTEEDAKKLYEALCSNAAPVGDDFKSTKAMYQKIIDGLLEQKRTGKLGEYESMDELEKAISKAVSEQASAPDKVTRAEPDFKFSKVDDSGDEEININAVIDNEELSNLKVINCNAAESGFNRVEFIRDLNEHSSGIGAYPEALFSETESKYFQPPKTSFEDAKKLAEDTIAKLGITDFVCSGSRLNALYDNLTAADDAVRKGVYEFMFTRLVANVPITYTNNEGNVFNYSEDPDANVNMPWMFEKIRIVIDDEGIYALFWNAPYDVKDAELSNTNLMPFDDINRIFKKMITITGEDYFNAGDGDTCEMHITRAALGYMRVTEKNVGESGLLIPVWDFMGWYEITTSDGEKYDFGKDGYESMLTINAVDGSIIDRSVGY